MKKVSEIHNLGYKNIFNLSLEKRTFLLDLAFFVAQDKKNRFYIADNFLHATSVLENLQSSLDDKENRQKALYEQNIIPRLKRDIKRQTSILINLGFAFPDKGCPISYSPNMLEHAVLFAEQYIRKKQEQARLN